MVYELTTGSMPPINIAPATVVEEVLQNIRTIMATTKNSVPLDRDLGLDPSYLDSPMEAAKGKFASELVLGIAKYEPRAAVMNIDWVGTIDGSLAAKVKVDINEQT